MASPTTVELRSRLVSPTSGSSSITSSSPIRVPSTLSIRRSDSYTNERDKPARGVCKKGRWDTSGELTDDRATTRTDKRKTDLFDAGKRGNVAAPPERQGGQRRQAPKQRLQGVVGDGKARVEFERPQVGQALHDWQLARVAGGDGDEGK